MGATHAMVTACLALVTTVLVIAVAVLFALRASPVDAVCFTNGLEFRVDGEGGVVLQDPAAPPRPASGTGELTAAQAASQEAAAGRGQLRFTPEAVVWQRRRTPGSAVHARVVLGADQSAGGLRVAAGRGGGGGAASAAWSAPGALLLQPERLVAPEVDFGNSMRLTASTSGASAVYVLHGDTVVANYSREGLGCVQTVDEVDSLTFSNGMVITSVAPVGGQAAALVVEEGRLKVASGALEVSGPAALSGATTLGSTLHVAGGTALGGTLQVAGVTTHQDLVTHQASVVVERDFGVDGTAHLNGNASVGGNMTVTGNASVAGTAQITGDAALNGHVNVAGNAAVTGDVFAAGDVAVAGNLDVTGSSTHTGNVSYSGNLSVAGNASAGGALRSNSLQPLSGSTVDMGGKGLAGVSTLTATQGNFITTFASTATATQAKIQQLALTGARNITTTYNPSSIHSVYLVTQNPGEIIDMGVPTNDPATAGLVFMVHNESGSTIQLSLGNNPVDVEDNRGMVLVNTGQGFWAVMSKW
jgi:cytoskeletal protein CcmA (bactofilin family)